MEHGLARRVKEVVGTALWVGAAMLAFGALMVLLVTRFPAHGLWIVGCMALLFSAGMGISIGLDWCKPPSGREDRQVEKRVGLLALLAVVGLILLDAFWHGFDIILLVSAAFGGGIGGMLAGFFIGRKIGRRRNAVQEHKP
jgi:hypothetical protein